MGMFDEIVCNMPLPGVKPAWLTPTTVFQTKDTPEQQLRRYRISAEGMLLDWDDHPVYLSGDVRFYTDNMVAYHLGAFFTRDGADFESVVYQATLVNGCVTDLRQVEYQSAPGLCRTVIGTLPTPTPEEAARRKAAMERLVVGCEVYVLYGGQQTGYRAVIKAVADGDLAGQDLCLLRLEAGQFNRANGFELMSRGDLGRTLFLSEEEARAARTAVADGCRALKARYDAQRRAWYERKGLPLPEDLKPVTKP